MGPEALGPGAQASAHARTTQGEGLQQWISSSLCLELNSSPSLQRSAAEATPSLHKVFHVHNGPRDSRPPMAHDPPKPSTSGKVPELCVEYGQQLEFRGSNDDALAMFESALSNSGSSSSAEEEKLASSAAGAAAAAAAAGGDEDDDEGVVAAREQEARRAVCLAGIARCTLRSGDLRKGLRLARGVG